MPVAKPFGTASTLADPYCLFTGKNPGTHLHPASLVARMNRLGIRARASPNTALLHLASTTPPAIFAGVIGVHITTATRSAELSGAAGRATPPPPLRASVAQLDGAAPVSNDSGLSTSLSIARV